MVARREPVGFRVLGPVELVCGDQSVTVGHTKQRSVLAVLLVEANQTVGTEQLIDRVWGDRPPARVRNVLSGYVTRLRSVISAAGAPPDEIALTHRSGGYLLTVPSDRVDLHRFRSLVAMALQGDQSRRESLLARALGLWRGPAFMATGGAWLDGMREALERERLTAEIARADAALRLGRHAQVVDDLAALVNRYPLDERLAGQLMLALRGSGRAAEALAVYATVRARLADELGVEPGGALRRLHQRLLDADAVPAPRAATPVADPVDPPTPPPVAAAVPRRAVVPRQLPPAAAHFTGRAALLRRLAELLAAVPGAQPGAVVMAVIHGSAGVGKTTLAVYWAHQVAPHFPDGQIYLNLRGFDQNQPPLQPTEALTAALRALDVAPQHIPSTVDEQASLYRSILADKRVLVVLDNAATSGQVRPLVPGASGCLVLVTSRNELSGLTAGDGAATVALDVLDRADAVTLLTRILGEPRASAVPGAAEALADLCAGLPLALRIVANHLLAHPAITLVDVLDDLNDERHRLDTLATDEESTSVRAVFSLSYHALKPEAARTFRLLGLHEGPLLSEPAAAALADLPVGRVRQLLSTLCQGHLLERVGQHRYQFHDLLHLYASERAAAEESDTERRRVGHRLLHWYLASAVAADRILEPGRYRGLLDEVAPPVPDPGFTDHQQALAWCDAESRNIVAAVRQAAACGEHEIAWQLAWAQWGYFELRKPWAEWLTTHRVGLDSARALRDRRAEAVLLNSLGMAHYYPRHFADAEDCWRRALVIWEDLGDLRGQASIANNLGNVLLETRELDRAIELYQRALRLYDRVSASLHAQATTMTNLAETHCLLGRYEAGLEYAQRALAAHRASGSRRAEALALPQAGNALRGLGRHDEALECYTSALRISREIGDRQAEGWASHYLAEALHTAGRSTEAGEYWRQAIELFDALGDPQAGDIRARLADLN